MQITINQPTKLYPNHCEVRVTNSKGIIYMAMYAYPTDESEVRQDIQTKGFKNWIVIK